MCKWGLNLKQSLPDNVRRTVLPNGVAVLTEQMPGQRSVSVGVWLGMGSRHDPVGKAGLAHLYEHMVFKGTKRRPAARISRELEEVGGHLNAFTSREQTCFYAKVLDGDMPRAVDLLCDMVTGAKLSERDLNKEKLVVLEEIRGCDDDPDELVSDLFAQALWANHPLGEPIAGSIPTVEPLSVADLQLHKSRSLSDEFPVVVTAAGNFQHDELVAVVTKALREKAPGAPKMQVAPRLKAKQTSHLVVEKDISQANLIIARRSLSARDEGRHALALVNLVLGGGMASRLNQQLREKRGLAYSVYSFADFMVGAGAIGVSLGTDPKQAALAIELVGQELELLRTQGLSKKDLEFARNYARGSSVLGLESPSARMQHLGKCQLIYGKPLSLEEILTTIDSVTLDQVNEACQLHFPPMTAANGWTMAAVVPEGLTLASL